MFRRGHDLHDKDRDAARAIRAYESYLRHYPRGRFVHEARYNLAINHIKLNQPLAAKDLLEPFARGDYGGYRQDEARTLLDAL
jgi:hypothetical protein